MAAFADATDTSSSMAREKQVSFNSVCQIIPNADYKNLRKLLKLYELGCNGCKPKRGDSSQPLWSPRLAKPKYELKTFIVPLTPAQWKPTTLKSSLAKLSMPSVDLQAVANGVGSAFGAPLNSNSSGPKQSYPPKVADERDNHDAEDARGRKRSSSVSDGNSLIAKSLRRASMSPSVPDHSTSGRDSVQVVVQDAPEDAPSDDEMACVAIPPQNRGVRMVVPTLTGWRRGSKGDAAAIPIKGCLIQSPKRCVAPLSDSHDLLLEPETSYNNTSSSDHHIPRRRRCEGLPVTGRVMQAAAADDHSKQGAAPQPRRQASFRLSLRRSPLAEASSPSFEIETRDLSSPQSDNHARQPESMSPSDPAVKKELKEGRWPFEERLNHECSCKNCHEIVSLGLKEDYKPQWSKSARVKWLADRREREARENQESMSSPLIAPLPKSASRATIMADEIDIRKGHTVQPPTSEEMETDAQLDDSKEAGTWTLGEGDVASSTSDHERELMTDDSDLEREVEAQRVLAAAAEFNRSLSPGARSMMRQLEIADQVERSASIERERRRQNLSSGSSCLSPISPPPVSQGGSASYFDIPVTSSPKVSPGYEHSAIATKFKSGWTSPADRLIPTRIVHVDDLSPSPSKEYPATETKKKASFLSASTMLSALGSLGGMGSPTGLGPTHSSPTNARFLPQAQKTPQSKDKERPGWAQRLSSLRSRASNINL